MNGLIQCIEADTERLKRQRQEVGGMVEVLQWIDAAAHRQIREGKAARQKARQEAVWAPMFSKLAWRDGHLWVPGVSASTSARSSLGWTTFFAAFVPGSSPTTTRSLGLEDYIAAFCLWSALSQRSKGRTKEILAADNERLKRNSKRWVGWLMSCSELMQQPTISWKNSKLVL